MRLFRTVLVLLVFISIAFAQFDEDDLTADTLSELKEKASAEGIDTSDINISGADIDGALTQLVENKEEIIESFNENSEEMPPELMSLVGNDRTNIRVTLDNGTEVVLGIGMKDGKLEDVTKGPISDPTLEIKFKEKDIREIAQSDDPVGTLVDKTSSEEVKIEGVGFWNWLKTALLNIFFKILGFIKWVISLFAGGNGG